MNQRIVLDGKFFRAGTTRFVVRGIAYGSFARNAAGEPFPEHDQVRLDLRLIADLGANTIRVYDVPPPALLDAAGEHGLCVLATLPWNQHTCFLDSRNRRREARTAVTTAVQSMGGHPAVLGVALANEIPADIVRWSGADAMARFLDELVDSVHQVDPACLCTYANFPPTEFLQPTRLDFVTFNLFLHSRTALTQYLRRLHLFAEGKPLLLGECGVDSLREGPERQAEILDWTLAAAHDTGLAGAIIFSFTDDWVRSGRRVTDWAMGITDVARQPKPAWSAVRARFTQPPPALPNPPRVSVIVASFNGATTLRECLESLLRQTYPRFEIIVVDDGSTDDTPAITTSFPQVRTLRLRENSGLSNARNLGIRAATGDVIAFTDADCRADEDWLAHLVARLLDTSVAAAGGPNVLPPEDGPLAAVVSAAPGRPSHVLLESDIAEHVPGCNMAFWRWALDALGGFDPAFRRAGDDVDICWRLQNAGWQIGFAASALVWHHRRATLKAYLRQQAGYGEAEAILQAKHPSHFNLLGNARWKGQIGHPTDAYSVWRRTLIHRGVFATGLFQVAYVSPATGLRALLTSLEFHLLVALPLVVLSVLLPWVWPLAVLALLLPPAVCVVTAWQAVLPRHPIPPWARPFLALMAYLQPIVRGANRLTTRLGLHTESNESPPSMAALSRTYTARTLRERAYWSPTWRERREWIESIKARLEEQNGIAHVDGGWDAFDLDIRGPRWVRLTMTTVAESIPDGSQILRCRLDPKWTFLAHAALWGVLMLEWVIVGVFDVNWRGFWVPLVTLAGFAALFRRSARLHQARVGVILDDLAREWSLTPIETPARPDVRSSEDPPDRPKSMPGT